MPDPVDILTAESQEFAIGSQLAAYLVALTNRAPGLLLFRTGAGRIYRDLLIHWPTLEEWEDEAQELCQRITDAVYPLAGALYAQAVELSVIIACAPVMPPGRVDALSTYVIFDANAGTEQHYYLSPEHPLPSAPHLSVTRGVIVLCRPLHYRYHTIKDDRRDFNHPHTGLYELSQRLINEMYEQPLFIPRERAVLSKVKSQINALPKEVERVEATRKANLATPTRHLAQAAPRIATVTSLSALPPPVRALERRLMTHVMDKTLSPELRLELRRAAQTLRAHFPQVMIDEAAHRETRPTVKIPPRASAPPSRQPEIVAQPTSTLTLSGIKVPPRSQPTTSPAARSVARPASVPPVSRQAAPYVPPVITTRFVPGSVPLSVPRTVVTPALQKGLLIAAQPLAARASFTPPPLSAAPASGIAFSAPRAAPSASPGTPQAASRQGPFVQSSAQAPIQQRASIQQAAVAPTAAPQIASATEQPRQRPAQADQPAPVRSSEPARPQASPAQSQQRPTQQTPVQPSPARQSAPPSARATPAQPTEMPSRTAPATPEPQRERQPEARHPQQQAQQEFRLEARREPRQSPRDAGSEPRSDFHFDKKTEIKAAPMIHNVAGKDVRRPDFYDQIRAPAQANKFSLGKEFSPRTQPASPPIFPRSESVGRLDAATRTTSTSSAPNATPVTHVAWNFPIPFLGLMPHGRQKTTKK